MPLSLSTCWLSHRFTDGLHMCEEIRNLGFSHTELSHGIPMTLVPGILKAVEKKIIRISSIHNFCPLPPGVSGPSPNIYKPSAPSSNEINLWKLYTKKSIDFASDINAPAMVTHMGSIHFLLNYHPKKLYNLSNKLSPSELSSNPYFKKITQKISQKAPKFHNRVLHNLQDILPYAQEKNIHIGVENRQAPTELPLDSLAHNFIEGQPNCHYWHDSGHAQLKEQMGLIKHLELLENNAHNTLGFHLKDVCPNGSEHVRLGTGTVDFQMIKSFIKPHHITVLEVTHHMPEEDLLDSKAFLQDLLS